MQAEKKERNIRSLLTTVLCCAAAFVLCLSLLFGLLYLSTCIPRGAVEENVLASAEYMCEKEGDFYYRTPNDPRTMIHDYADAVYLNMLYSFDGTETLYKLIAAPLYATRSGEDAQVDNLLVRVQNDIPANAVYDRYWHGMLVFLRPLLTVTDISGVRTVITGVLLMMLGTLCVLLWLHGQRDLAVILVLAAGVIRFHMTGQCIEYSPTWLVGLAFAIWAVFLEKASLRKLAVLFVLSGVCCAFFDFLTTETVALLLPLVVVLCMQYQAGTLKTFREGFAVCWLAGLVWLAAYAGAYMTKWILAEITLGGGRIAVAVSQAAYRQGNSAGGGLRQPVMALATNLWTLFAGGSSMQPMTVLVLFFVALVPVACVVYVCHRKQEDCALPVLLYLLACVPLLRMLVMNSHSLYHTFFTHRALFSTVVCLLLATWRIIDWDLFRGKQQKKTRAGKKRARK